MVMYAIIVVIVVVAAILIYKRKAVNKVPQGLQVLDTTQNVVYYNTTVMTRFVDRRRLYGSGTVSVSDLGCSGSKIFVVMIIEPYYGANYNNPPTISMSITDTTLTWKNLPKSYSEGVPADVMLGVY